jgi:hypothetical protein
MFGPGAYRSDPTEGITAIADLPPPEIVHYSRNDKRQPCPRCGHSAYRDKQSQRTLHDLGNLDVWCPRDLVVTYSQHYCTKCRKYFNAGLSDLAPPGSQYTHRVMDLAVRLVVEDGLPYRPASWHLWRDHRVFVPFATIQNWVEAGGKKGAGAHAEPLLEVFGDVPHQICTFHIVAEISKAVLGAVASAHKGLIAQQPKLRKGRPSTPAATQAARTKKRLATQRAALFASRYLFVQRHLNKTERKTLWRVSRGFPQLQMLRVLMEQVYALFDRRCRSQTALAKLATLRRRVQRFKALGDTLKKLFSPTLEKALTFLDDTLLPSTSNAVERGNRRYRQMQKSVYRVRTQVQIRTRLALDMWREAQAEGRQHTLAALHRARAG